MSSRAHRIKFKLAVIVHQALCYVAGLWTRTRLRSSTSRVFDVHGDRPFSTAGPQLWNSVPEDAQSASSLTIFADNENYLFRQSYPDVSCMASSVQRRKLWLTLSTWLPCSNAAKMRKPLKLGGVPKLPDRYQPLVGRSSPYYEDIWRRYCSLSNFFWLSIRALVAKI